MIGAVKIILTGVAGLTALVLAFNGELTAWFYVSVGWCGCALLSELEEQLR